MLAYNNKLLSVDVYVDNKIKYKLMFSVMCPITRPVSVNSRHDETKTPKVVSLDNFSVYRKL